MKFYVKAVELSDVDREEPLKDKPAEEPRAKILPPVRNVSYAWAYIAAFAVILTGMLIGRKKKRKQS